MTEARLAETGSFLARLGWGDAGISALAGDASARRYFRLSREGAQAVLMDADPVKGESIGRFLDVGQWLLSKGYSAPKILGRDAERGFLLLEDLGDGLFARLVRHDPAQEAPLYSAATAFLADLHRHPPPAFLSVADGAALARLVALTPEWYLAGTASAPSASTDRIVPLIAGLFDRLNDAAPVMSLRDFHAENLIWLPERVGVARVGLLDFQDAFATHPAYDLVSLLQDARRDVPGQQEATCIAAYCEEKTLDQSRFSTVYAVLGAQRALRIIGVFTRLSLHFGKPQYLDFMPRVWGYLQRNLTHPALAELATAVRDGLPEPTPERLQRIADKCGTFPNP